MLESFFVAFFVVVNCSLKFALNYRKQLQQQGEFSPCRTPTGLVDARDQYDLQLGRLSTLACFPMCFCCDFQKLQILASIKRAMSLSSNNKTNMSLII